MPIHATKGVGGLVLTSELGTGNASSSTFLRGDGTWASAGGGFEFPVGYILISAVNTNPSTFIGYGTWGNIGAGRVLVGLDSGDPDFDTLGETGGAKTVTLTEAQIPAHTHTQNSHNHTQDSHSHTQASTTTATGSTSNRLGTNDTSSTAVNTGGTVATNQAATAVNQNAGGGGSHPNVQPYLVVYFWQRSA